MNMNDLYFIKISKEKELFIRIKVMTSWKLKSNLLQVLLFPIDK